MKIFKFLEKKISAYNEDLYFQIIVNGMILAFSLRVLGAGLTFFLNIVIARLLGAEGTGIFFLALAISTIGSVIGRVGLDNALLRFVSAHAGNEEWDHVLGVHILAIKICLVASGTVTLILTIFAPFISDIIFKNPDLSQPLRWMSLTILPMSILTLEGQSLKGLKKITDSILLQGVLVPLLVLLFIFPLVSLSGIIGVTWAYLIASIFVGFYGWIRWKRITFSIKKSNFAFNSTTLLESCKFLYPVALINRAVIPWFPILFLGIWVSPDDTGIFGVASRVSMLVSFLLTTLNNVVAPIFSELYTKGKLDKMAKTARSSAMIITILSIPVFLPLILFSEIVMSLFGAEFERGGKVLLILAIGQLTNTFCGSVGFLLNMSGNERANSKVTLISLIVLIVSMVLLIPPFGIIGAAIASSASVITFNILAFYQAERKIGIKLRWI